MGASEIRSRLADYHTFITFTYGLAGIRIPGSEIVEGALNELASFLRTATGRELRERAPVLEDSFGRLIKDHAKAFPPKKSVRAIARDFRLLQVEQDVWKSGIPCGWLAARFDISFLRQADDLPSQARIGIGVHQGFVQVEEVSLITDTFFLLLRARDSARQLRNTAGKAHLRNDVRAYQAMSALNAVVCTYSRLGVLTASAFVEAFVNSVGWNEVENRRFTADDEEQLRGMKKGRYLSLEAKLERFPRIIRADKQSPIVVSDPAQLREPFRRFLEESRGVRDASMHFAPGKAAILRPPFEWLQLVETSVEDAVAVAREFWSACYPSRAQPKYLADIDFQNLLRYAADSRAAELIDLETAPVLR